MMDYLFIYLSLLLVWAIMSAIRINRLNKKLIKTDDDIYRLIKKLWPIENELKRLKSDILFSKIKENPIQIKKIPENELKDLISKNDKIITKMKNIVEQMSKFKVGHFMADALQNDFNKLEDAQMNIIKQIEAIQNGPNYDPSEDIKAKTIEDAKNTVGNYGQNIK